MSTLSAVQSRLHDWYDPMLVSIQKLVEFETPSTDHDRLDACAAYLQQKFSQAGAHCEIVEVAGAGNHLQATWPGQDPSLSPALVLTHFDTVWPMGRIASHPFRREAGKAFGPGIFDMKTSIVVMEYIFRALQQVSARPPRPITLLATADEEVGSTTSKDLIEAAAAQAAFVLVLEPPLPGGVLKTARKGSQAIKVTTSGIAAHAGIEIEKGVSAIEEAAYHILTVQGLTNRKTGITANVGVVKGGTRSNVVADSAEFEVDLRGWDRESLDAALQTLCNLQPRLTGAGVHVDASRGRPPLESKVTDAIFAAARSIARGLHMDLRGDRTGGGSDGNLTGAMGVATLDGLGVPGGGAHAEHEHIELDRLVQTAQLVAALLWELPSHFPAGKAFS